LRALLERGQLAPAKLVDDLARFLIAEIVESGALQGRQHLQGGPDAIFSGSRWPVR
jgi:hypothetical protein